MAADVHQNNHFVLQVVCIGFASSWVGAAAGGQGCRSTSGCCSRDALPLTEHLPISFYSPSAIWEWGLLNPEFSKIRCFILQVWVSVSYRVRSCSRGAPPKSADSHPSPSSAACWPHSCHQLSLAVPTRRSSWFPWEEEGVTRALCTLWNWASGIFQNSKTS